MKPELLSSCANCWFNGLQYGSIGLSVGYCTEYRVVLRRSEETTCAKHMRKDLLYKSSVVFSFKHKQHYSLETGVQRLTDTVPVVDNGFVSRDTDFLRTDSVGDVVADYGEYGTKIESLSQLRALSTLRSELAMLSLARAYTARCVKRDGSWTSGIHILWWTRRKLADAKAPEVHINDLRYSSAGSLESQMELVQWSLLMFRLVFISDIGVHAAEKKEVDVGRLEGIAELAAEETEKPSLRKLAAWIKKRGLPLFDEALSEATYRRIVNSLVQPDPHDGA